MLGAQDKVTLFGRFRLMPRPDLERLLADRGVSFLKDLTRQTTLFVVGAGAGNLIRGGALPNRLAQAKTRGIPVMGERRLLAVLEGAEGTVGTLPVEHVAAGLSDSLVDLLNAFDLISLTGDLVRFEDSDTLHNARELEAGGMEPHGIVEALARRHAAPRGRHRIALDSEGRAILKWDDGQTTLSGQGMLPLEGADSLGDLFDAAMDAEAAGDMETARRHYETCARADRRDPIAAFNLGNVCAVLDDPKAARLAYERALARDPDFSEARFNLSGILELLGDREAAVGHLRRALESAPDFADAVFNLAQLELAAGNHDAAEGLFRKYVALSGPEGWTDKARKALRLIELNRTSGKVAEAKEPG